MNTLDKLKEYKVIIFAFEHYNPLDQIRTFASIGVRPIGVFIKSKNRFSSVSKYLSKVFYVNDVEEGIALIRNNFKSLDKKAFIITSDDIITNALAKHYDDLNQNFYFNYCYGEQSLNDLMSKVTQLKIASECGFDIPLLYKSDDENIIFPVIVKSCDSLINDWKKKTRICYNSVELHEAKTLNNNDIFIEEYIDRKDEIAVQGYSYDRGSKCVCKLCLTRDYLVDGAPGKKFYLKRFENKNILKLINKFIESIKFSGAFEMEFLVDKNDRIYFSEINLRNSGLGYATTVGGASNLLGWCCSCIDGNNHIPQEPTFEGILVGMDEFSDLKLRVFKEKKIPFFRWYKEIKKADFLFYYDKKDKKPFRKALMQKIFKRSKSE